MYSATSQNSLPSHIDNYDYSLRMRPINQDAKINLQLQNASIKQVFSAIKKQANVSFMYSNDDVANLPRKIII